MMTMVIEETLTREGVKIKKDLTVVVAQSMEVIVKVE